MTKPETVVEVRERGIFEGRPDVRAYEGRFFGASEEYYVRPERIVATGDDVIIHYTQRGSRNDDGGARSSGVGALRESKKAR